MREKKINSVVENREAIKAEYERKDNQTQVIQIDGGS